MGAIVDLLGQHVWNSVLYVIIYAISLAISLMGSKKLACFLVICIGYDINKNMSQNVIHFY